MERFVQSIVAGGVALLAGLWIVALADATGEPTAVAAGGLALAAIGTAGVFAGIWSELSL